MNTEELRSVCNQDLFAFAKYVNPHRVYGDCHKETFKWWQDCEKKGKDNTLLLDPRDHQKSHCAAVYAAWEITKNPAITILYISATTTLAEKQLKAIKDMITSARYTRLWPNMAHPDEGKREKWNSTEICVDHPIRKEEGVRDSTVYAAGLTTTITGLHASLVFLDDIVTPDNAFTGEGRSKVRAQYSQLASIETTGAREIVVGTRYHPKDIYGDLIEMIEPEFDNQGNVIGEELVYSCKVRVVEIDGRFLWPREARKDGKWFGFNAKELARKKAKYLDKSQFYAQYYQEPNDPDSHRVQADRFEYYDQKHIKDIEGDWFYKGSKLNVYAGMDFAFSLRKQADFSAIVVIGIDSEGYIYVLDIDRFKTNKIKMYYDHAVHMHEKWGFRKMRAEITAAQVIIVNDLKDEFRKEGRSIVIDDHNPRTDKGERIAAALEPRYENKTILHFRGGYTSMLEEEVVLAKPPHDDLKDALASVIEIAVRPRQRKIKPLNVVPISRFGGVQFRV